MRVQRILNILCTLWFLFAFAFIGSVFVDVYKTSHKPSLPYDPHITESAQIIQINKLDPSRSQIILCCDGTTWAWDKTLTNPKWVPINVTIEAEK